MFVKIFLFASIFNVCLSHNHILIDKVIDKLHSLLDFILEDVHNILIDGIKGVNVCQAQLNEIIQLIDEPKIRWKLIQLSDKAKLIYEIKKGELIDYNRYGSMVPTLIKYIEPENWKNNITFFFTESLDPIDQNLDLNTNSKEIFQNYIENYLIPDFFNTCLENIILKKCTIDKQCEKYIFGKFDPRDPTFRSYGLSHKIILMQTLRFSGCLYEKEILLKNCELFLWQFRNLFYYKLQNSRDQNLMIDAVMMCGFEGFADFFNENFIRYHLSLIGRNGCIEDYSISEIRKRKRVKRYDKVMKYDCLSHINGHSAAVFALDLRFLLTNRKIF